MPHKDIEELLFCDLESQKALNKKILREIKERKANHNAGLPQITKNISEVQKGTLFTPHTTWQVTNLKNLAVFELRGNNIELFLIKKPFIKNMLEIGELDAFCYKNLFITFLKGPKSQEQQVFKENQ